MTAVKCLSSVLTILIFCNSGFAQGSGPPNVAGGNDSGIVSDVEALEVASVEIPDFDSGHVAWMLVCSALVLMMTAPGLALFYGGLVRKKNILSVMMQCVFLMGLMSMLWAVVGYSWAFGGSSPYLGNFEHVCLRGVVPELASKRLADLESQMDGATEGREKESLSVQISEMKARVAANRYAIYTPGEGNDIPVSLFMVFQGMFFIITPALICGAFAERMKFSSMCLFMVLWGLLVYCPIAHWVWSDPGFLCEWNENALFPALDFAGGTVVHISSGVSALVCAIFIGKRVGYGKDPMPPHNLTYTLIGTALLWVGWFGFNAGSALSAGTGAVNAFVATHLAASGGVVAWSVAEWVLRGKPTLLGACSGGVAGLVCVTPACGSVTAMSGVILGLVAGLVCFWACTGLKKIFKYDDSLDAFGVHGVGGTVGALLTGVFADMSIVGKGDRIGLLESGFTSFTQFFNQVVSIAAAAALAVAGTLILLTILNMTIGIRVSPEDEQKGLDISEHGEEGYIFL
jgi:Amt family ammonium transporter